MEMVLNSSRAESSGKKTRDITNPATGRVIDSVPVADEADIKLAIDSAQNAFSRWERTPLHRRAEILSRFLELVRENRDELANTLCLDNGKPITQARAEIDNLFISVNAFIEKGKHLYDSLIPPGSEKNQENNLQIIKREPVGIIVCIIPFNFPSNLFSQKVIPSLLMGNCVLVLPPSGNPLTVLSLSSLLIRAGIPEGVLSCICAPGSVKEAAIRDPRTALVTLTGSTATGIRVAGTAAADLTRTALELGGNDPFIVFEDADLDLVINELFVARLVNAGQICCASKRFIIHSSLADEFTKRAVQYVNGLKMGDPMDETTRIGCLIDEEAAKEVESQVNLTLKAGARLLAGGVRKGAFYSPAVLTNVTRDMDVAKDMEIFGPVIPVITFDSEDEAIAIANNSRYGLSSCIFSEDHRRILRLISRLEAGNVVINGASNLRSFEMPFGGLRQSGIGTEGVMSTFEEVTRKKVIILKGYEF